MLDIVSLDDSLQIESDDFNLLDTSCLLEVQIISVNGQSAALSDPLLIEIEFSTNEFGGPYFDRSSSTFKEPQAITCSFSDAEWLFKLPDTLP